MKYLNCIIFNLFLLGINFSCKAQKSPDFKIEKYYLDKDSSVNHYTVVRPHKLPLKGYAVLVPGFGEEAKDVMFQTDLPHQLASNGILTIIPTFQHGVLSFGVDSLSQATLNTILKDVASKHKVDQLPFYIGGFSIGGSCAVKYAELAQVKPKAVFAIDPPLDIEQLYNSSKRDIRLSKEESASEENKYIVGRIENEAGGSPSTHLANYHKLSPYSFTDTTQHAIKKIVAVPLRIYTEPDIGWWLKERSADFTGMNATLCSAMINELNRLGNKRAFLITTQGRGIRKPDNSRHPHSWSIVDNVELVKWLLVQ